MSARAGPGAGSAEELGELALALDALPDAVVVAGPDGAVRRSNDLAARLAGRPAARLVGRPAAQVLPLLTDRGADWWTVVNPFAGAARRSRCPEQAVTLHRPDGSAWRLFVTARFVREPRGGPLLAFVVVLRDGNPRERQRRGDGALLAGAAAHELRAPLAGVRALLAGLRAGDVSRAEQDALLRVAEGELARADRLARGLLDTVRLGAGLAPTQHVPVDVTAAVADSVRRTTATTGDEPARVDVRLDAPRIRLETDPDRLGQILDNLLDNALRHGAGQVTVRAGVRGAELLLTVRDEGDGFEPAAISHAGLGLRIGQALASALGGSLTVGPGRGLGAVATLRLPLSRRPPGNPRTARAAACLDSPTDPHPP